MLIIPNIRKLGHVYLAFLANAGMGKSEQLTVFIVFQFVHIKIPIITEDF